VSFKNWDRGLECHSGCVCACVYGVLRRAGPPFSESYHVPRNKINKPGKWNALGSIGLYRYTYRPTVNIFAVKDTGIYAPVIVQMYKINLGKGEKRAK